MKTKTHEVPGHCGHKNGGRITVREGDKQGFVCEICKQAFDIDYDGNITASSLVGMYLRRCDSIVEGTASGNFHKVERPS